MKLFMDLDETMVKSISKEDYIKHDIKSRPDFIVSDEGIPGYRVFIRPDLEELEFLNFSVYTASEMDYAIEVVDNIIKLKPWFAKSVVSIFARDSLSIYPGKHNVYNSECVLIDERATYDSVVQQKLNTLPLGRHVRIKPFDIVDQKVKITDKPGMSLKEALILAHMI